MDVSMFNFDDVQMNKGKLLIRKRHNNIYNFQADSRTVESARRTGRVRRSKKSYLD